MPHSILTLEVSSDPSALLGTAHREIKQQKPFQIGSQLIPLTRIYNMEYEFV